MAGTFSKNNRPDLAGSYFNWEAEGVLSVPPSTGQIVAIPGTCNWGPIRTTVLLENFDQYVGVFGNDDTPLRRAVYSAFKGEGRAGKGGAGAVIAYRQGTSAAAFASKILKNTAGTDALTLTALYRGTFANRFRITTQPSATVGATDLILLDGSRVVATYTHPSADLASFAADINANDPYFSATVPADGTALAAVSASQVSGGLDGEVLSVTEWMATQTAFDTERWSVFAAYALTDPSVRAGVVAWIKERNRLGARCRAVVGGSAGETVATAITRSQAINHWDVINLGGGTLHFDDLGVDASMAEMTARVAGSIARRGETRDMIFVRFADVSPVPGVPLSTLTEQVSCLKAGVTVFCQDTNAVPIFIKEGVTTYSNDAQSTVVNGIKTHPVRFANGTKAYASIKNLAIQHAIELAADDWFTSGEVGGELPVNERTRALALGFLKGLYQDREDAEVVQPGWTVTLDGDADDDLDYVSYQHGFHPTRSLRQMFHTARMG